MTLPLKRLSVYVKGLWAFATFETPTSELNSQKFYYMKYDFGLLPTTQKDPKKALIKGVKGQYVAQDALGVLCVVSAEDYATIFPKKVIDQKPQPAFSSSLSDPRVITNVLRKSKRKDSNTIQVGTSTTFISVDPKRTISITPTGIQRGLTLSGTYDPFNLTDAPAPEEDAGYPT